MAKILVVDDEMGIRELLHEILEDESHEVVLAQHAAAARMIYSQTPLDLVLLDIWMPDIDGMTLLREWVSAGPLRCPVVMMSGHASIDTALEANELGAVGFLEKPITLQRLLSTVHKILTRSNPLTYDQTNVGSEPSSLSDSGTLLRDEVHENLRLTSYTSLRGIANSAKSHPTPIHSSSNLSPWQLALTKLGLETSFRNFRENSERLYFEHLLDLTHHSMTRVSEISGLERTHLYRKFKQLGVEVKRQNKSSR